MNKHISITLAANLVVSATTPAFAHGAANSNWVPNPIGHPQVSQNQNGHIYSATAPHFAQAQFAQAHFAQAQSLPLWTAPNRGLNWQTVTDSFAHKSASPSWQTLVFPQAGAATIATDLSSTKHNVILTSNLFSADSAGVVTIDIAGQEKTFHAGASVTAAEYLAIKQVQSEGSQSIILAANGTASGGSFNVNLVSNRTTELVIPKGVTALDNLSINPIFSILGDIFNYGSLSAIGNPDTSAAALVGTIAGHNIVNGRGATIVGTGPATELTLIATNNFTNAGTISTGGNLNLAVGSGHLVNSGLIQSTAANINIAGTAGDTALALNSTGGTFSATGGNINIGNYPGPGGAIELNGGNYLSQALNIYAGQNAIFGNVGEVTGKLNTTANAEHFSAAAQSLVLGSNTIDGDPTFVNTAPGGTIVISGVNTFTEAVAILANGDITTAAGGQIVTNGADVTIIAGAKTETKGSIQTGISGASATQNVTVTLDPFKSSGGNIDFSANAASTVIDTSTKAGGGNAGNVLLIGFANGAAVGGKVLLGTNNINASTTGIAGVGKSHNGGNVTIYAGAVQTAATDTITAGTITTGAGPGHVSTYYTEQSTGGAIGLYTQEAQSSNVNHTLVFNTVGQITSGKVVPSTLANRFAGVKVGDLNTVGDGGVTDKGNKPTAGSNAGAITVVAGGDINAQNLYAFGAGGAGGTALTSDPENTGYKGAAGGDGAAISVSSSGGGVYLLGQANTSGGGGGGGAGQNSSGFGAGQGGAGGKAANITIQALGNQVVVSSGAYAVDGAAGGNGGGYGLPINRIGGGGGGGGSYGGGGGAGADGPGAGGGGGGGAFGGGGGAVLGGGGGSTVGGISGGGAATAGSAGMGGNGATGATGGALGMGGAGAPSGGGVGVNIVGSPGENANASKAVINIKSGKSSFPLQLPGLTIADKVTVTTIDGGYFDVIGSITAFSQLTIDCSDKLTPVSGTLTAPVVSLNSATKSIGSAGNAMPIVSPSVSATAPQGDVYIQDSGTKVVTLTKALAKNTFSFVTDGGAPIDEYALVATASPIQAGATILTVNNNGGINAVTQTNAMTLNVATGKATISNTGALTITGTSKVFYDFDLKQKSGSGQFDSAQITLAGDVSSNVGKINIAIDASTNHTGGIVGAGGSLQAGVVTIKNDDNGNIGTAAKPISTFANSLRINTLGDVFVSSGGNVTIDHSTSGAGNAASPGTTFSVTSTGKIAIGAGGIINTPNKSGVGSIILNSNGSIGTSAGGGEIKSPSITLIDGTAGKGTGDIGTAGAPLKIEAKLVSAATQGSVYLLNNGGSNINVAAVTLPAGKTFALINQTGGINTLPGGGMISAPTVVLSAAAGRSIGESGESPLKVDATSLTLSAGRFVFIDDAATATVTLNQASIGGVTYSNKAGSLFLVLAQNANTLTNVQAIKASDINLQAVSIKVGADLTADRSMLLAASGMGNIFIDFPITAQYADLVAGDGTIVQTKPITASGQLTIRLANGTANLPLAGNDINSLGTKVTGLGQVILTVAKPLKLESINGANQMLTLNYTGSLTVNQAFTVDQVKITPNPGSKNSSVSINAPITATSLANIQANGTGTLTSAGVSSTGNIDMTADAGNISLTGAHTAQQFTITTKGGDISQTANAPITAVGALVINLNAAATADLSKAANDVKVFNDNVVGASIVSLKTTPTITLSTIKGTGQSLTVIGGDGIVTPSVIEA